MKRFICILLSLVIAINIPGVRVSAMENAGDVFAEIADDADEMMAGQVDIMEGISSGVVRLVKDLDMRLIAEQQMSFFNSFMTGVKTLSLGLSLVNGTVSFLKLIGVMEDPTATMLGNIYDCVLDIQETVHAIDKRTEDIQKSLVAQSGQSTFNFRLDRYDSYRQSWNAFFDSNGAYDEMRRLIDAYQSEFTGIMLEYAQTWQNGDSNGIRALYSDSDINLYSGANLDGAGVELPKLPSYSDDGNRVYGSIMLPGSYIAVEDMLINGESYLGLLENAVSEGVRNALADGALVATDELFYDRYEAMTDVEKDSLAQRIARDMLDALSYEAAYETANSRYDVGTFANAVNSAFTAFSNAVLGVNGVTSPLESGLCKLSLTHGFEGEVKDEAAAVCGYIAETAVAYGEFTAFVTSLDKGITSKTRDSILDRCLKTAYYPICYHDSFITGYDNYCYPLNALIDYDAVCFKADYSYKSGEPYEPKDLGWRIEGANSYSTSEDVNEILKNNRMVSKEDMALLYLYYEAAASENAQITRFNDYLDTIGILHKSPSIPYLTASGFIPLTPGSLPVNVCDRTGIYLTSAPESYNLMKQKVDVYRTRDKDWGETIQFYKSDNVKLPAGKLDYSKEGESTVDYHDRMRADVFDAASQGIALDSRLQNTASLAERAYTYYVMSKDYGAGRYVYVVFADPGSSLYYDYQSKGTSTLTLRSANYSMLSYSPVRVRSGSSIATIFGEGNLWIIGGGAVLAVAAVVTALCINKKKKEEQ